VVYSKQQAITIMQYSTAGDMTYALAQQLIAAKLDLNCAGGNSSCVATAIANADAWLSQHPVGSHVQAKSAAWADLTHDYNVLCSYCQGQLCAPHCGQ
jgi:propanediol dehydratase large subunit